MIQNETGTSYTPEEEKAYFTGQKHGKMLANERKPYSAEDMCEFANWIKSQEIMILSRRKKEKEWASNVVGSGKIYTSEELLKLWEETRNG